MTEISLLCKAYGTEQNSPDYGESYSVIEIFEDFDVAHVTCGIYNQIYMNERIEFHMTEYGKPEHLALSDFAKHESVPFFVLTFDLNLAEGFDKQSPICLSHY